MVVSFVTNTYMFIFHKLFSKDHAILPNVSPGNFFPSKICAPGFYYLCHNSNVLFLYGIKRMILNVKNKGEKKHKTHITNE